jgi:hypothetical protein
MLRLIYVDLVLWRRKRRVCVDLRDCFGKSVDKLSHNCKIE